MDLVKFLIRSAVYVTALLLAWYGMSSVSFEGMLKKGHVREAQVLYFMIVTALAYLCGSFVLALIWRF